MSDYAHVVSIFSGWGDEEPRGTRPAPAATARLVWWQHNHNDLSGVQRTLIASPFQRADVAPGATLQSGAMVFRVRFSSVADGLSNQLFMGEKHIPFNRLGRCGTRVEDVTTGDSRPFSTDCSYLVTNWHWEAMGSARNISSWETDTPRHFALSRPSDHEGDGVSPLRTYGFGGPHPGVCNFVMGDGSVRSISVTTQFSVLRTLSIMNSGETVALP
jgi:prepilin-type processing-associated H-X9-DG protein